MISFRIGPVTLPINPENIRDGEINNNRIVEIVSTGEIAIPGTARLKTWQIESLFWAEKMESSVIDYIEILKKISQSKFPVKFVVSDLNISSFVIIEEFTTDIRTDEEQDAYYILKLLEYKPYRASKVDIQLEKTPFDPETSPEPTFTPESTISIDIGNIVYFIGGEFFASSTSTEPVRGERLAGDVIITNIANGRVHVVATAAGGSDIEGWVNLSSIRGFTQSPVTTSSGNIAIPPISPTRDLPASAVNWFEYNVRSGDSLTSIAEKYANYGAQGATADDLRNANPLLTPFAERQMMSAPTGARIRIPEIWRINAGAEEFSMPNLYELGVR